MVKVIRATFDLVDNANRKEPTKQMPIWSM